MLENITRREKLKGTDKQAHPHNFPRNCMLSSLCCSSVMATEKDASEAIRSVVATLPNIQKLKPEQEQLLLFLVAMMLWPFSPRGSGKVRFSSYGS